jgi:peptide/nickel transport system permease protein
VVAVFACLSFFSPYPPNDSFVVPPDVPPSAEYWFGTTSRGQDLFWLLTFAIRNTLLFGIVVAVLSRLLALLIGLVAGLLRRPGRPRADVRSTTPSSSSRCSRSWCCSTSC